MSTRLARRYAVAVELIRRKSINSTLYMAGRELTPTDIMATNEAVRDWKRQ